MAREDAQRIIDLAWLDLPRAQRILLESIGCHQRQAVEVPLGVEVAALYISAGLGQLPAPERAKLDAAIGVWVPQLRLLLVNKGHPAFNGLNDPSYEEAMARAAWHEWGHALSLHRATEEDVAAGRELLRVAPPGIAEFVRHGGYRGKAIVHELVADIYSLLMARRLRGGKGKPEWLDNRLWDLVVRTTGWAG